MGWVMDTSNRDVDYDNIELLFTFQLNTLRKFFCLLTEAKDFCRRPRGVREPAMYGDRAELYVVTAAMTQSDQCLHIFSHAVSSCQLPGTAVCRGMRRPAATAEPAARFKVRQRLRFYARLARFPDRVRSSEHSGIGRRRGAARRRWPARPGIGALADRRDVNLIVALCQRLFLISRGERARRAARVDDWNIGASDASIRSGVISRGVIMWRKLVFSL